MRQRIYAILFCVTIGCLVLPGCSKEQVLGWFGGSTATPAPPAPRKKKAPPKPFMQLDVTPIFKTASCYVELSTFNNGARANILRIRSYETEETEEFPSMLIYAQVQERSLESLVDKEISASLYAATGEESAVWHHDDAGEGKKIKVKIKSVTEAGIEGQIAGGSVTTTHNTTPVPAKGRFFGVRYGN